MSTEDQVTQPEDTGEQTTQQYSEVELRALEMGWRPKEEFDGDEADFVDAKEFVGRKPLYDKIAQLSKGQKAVTQALDALKGHYSKVRETEFNRAITALREERKRAIAEGDGERVDAIETQIDTAKQHLEVIKFEAQQPAVEEAPTVHPEFTSWQARNPWYENTKYMREFADEQGRRLANTMSPVEVLKEVEKLVRKEFPHKFTNPNKADAPDVGSNKGTTRTPKGADIELSDQERKIMNTLVSQGVLTKEKYIADLKAAKGVK
jgi:hypothetical protein